ncbi:MAG: hypothetical protein HQK65_08535 [Desulfamplus sp.]|nr:hypothetical protein [Desulfamplus sp.]
MIQLVHPFEWLSHNAQKRAFIALAILTVVLMASLQILGMPLITKSAPYGIVSFEFAGDQIQAQKIVESWKLKDQVYAGKGQVYAGKDQVYAGKGQVYAGLNLGLDYLFLVIYSSCIGLGCVLISQKFVNQTGFLFSTGICLAWGQVVAALLDSVENYALIQVVLGSMKEFWPVMALWCASLKFILIALGIVYLVAGWFLCRFQGFNSHYQNR